LDLDFNALYTNTKFIIIAIASFNINEDVKEKDKEENVMLLQRKGDIIEIIPA
jgi:hypothetical protein